VATLSATLTKRQNTMGIAAMPIAIFYPMNDRRGTVPTVHRSPPATWPRLSRKPGPLC
jgi:hypothetical protein